MLKEKDILEIKDMLMQMKTEILTKYETTIKKSGISEEREIGDIFDDADIEQAREFNLMLGTRERQKLEQIDSALTRIENNEYGQCEDCEEDIPAGRLKAMPFATLCVKCKSERESLEGPLSQMEKA